MEEKKQAVTPQGLDRNQNEGNLTESELEQVSGGVIGRTSSSPFSKRCSKCGTPLDGKTDVEIKAHLANCGNATVISSSKAGMK